ncbi:MAG: rhodanese-like domain-containing protein [SAR86 cluster bacterium]|jgi:rhodanese-related sulfurtransferase|nr:rhodanese-like domain-containing protein [SAR86 cluster bacterium]
MENLLLFLAQNIFAFFVLIFLVFFLIFYEGKKGGKRVDNTEATRLINKENCLVLDLRPAHEFNIGHLSNAVNLLIEDVGDQINTLQKDKEKPLLLVCQTGSVSKKAGISLKKSGYENLYILSGGMMGWQNAGLPTIK